MKKLLIVYIYEGASLAPKARLPAIASRRPPHMPSVGPPARPLGLHGRLACAACLTADVAVVTAIVIIIEAGLSAVMAPLSGVLIFHLQIYNKSTIF